LEASVGTVGCNMVAWAFVGVGAWLKLILPPEDGELYIVCAILPPSLGVTS